MSNPSFSNIDLWLFELNEGNLSPTQVEQLQAFLLQHPELDVDKDVWQNAHIQPQKFIYSKKESLIRANPIFRLMDYASVAVVLFAIVTIAITSNTTQSTNTIAKIEGSISQDLKEFTNQQTHTKKIEKSRVNSNIASSNGLVNAFSSAMNTFVTDVTPLRINANIPSEDIISRVNVAENNVDASFTNPTQVTNGTVDYSSPVESNSALNNISGARTPSNSYGRGLVQNVDAINENSNKFTSYSFYDVNNLNLKGLDKELGNDDYSLVEMNKDHEMNFFQKKKKTITKYQLMLKNRVGSFGRKVMNMMNNPIALNNFRDPHYNIPGLSVSDINFSSAGTQLATRVQTFSRMQWYGKENQQLMNQLNVDGYVYAVRGGLALQLNHAMYKNGGVSVADVGITYSPKFSISNTVSLEPSFRFKMGNKSLNHSKMDGMSQLEIERGVVEDYYADGSTPIGSNLWYKDFGAGVTVNTKWFFVSAQVDNLFRHKDNMFSNTSDNPQRSDYQIIGSIGTDWVSRNKYLSLSPYVVYQNQGQLSEVWVGANARLKWFVIGASYSSTRNPSATIGVKFKRFSMYYNADYSKSVMTGERNLSHQVTLKFVGKQNRFGKGR